MRNRKKKIIIYNVAYQSKLAIKTNNRHLKRGILIEQSIQIAV